MKLNEKKTKDLWICFKNAIPEPPLLMIDNEVIERVKSFKPIRALIWLFAACKLHKYGARGCTADWPYGSFPILWLSITSIIA